MNFRNYSKRKSEEEKASIFPQCSACGWFQLSPFKSFVGPRKQKRKKEARNEKEGETINGEAKFRRLLEMGIEQ